MLASVVEEAGTLFELPDGAPRPNPGVVHPRDPVADLKVIDWLADLHASDDNLLFEKGR